MSPRLLRFGLAFGVFINTLLLIDDVNAGGGWPMMIRLVSILALIFLLTTLRDHDLY